MDLSFKKNKRQAFISRVLLTINISLLMLLCNVTHVLGSTDYTQMTLLSFNLKNVAIEEVLNKIEEKSEYRFLYNKNIVDVEKKVNIRVDNKNISFILNELFKSENIQYTVNDRQIVLSTKEGVGQSTVQQNPRTVKGVVLDPNGEPLIGVTVGIKGTSTGVASDVNGHFSIQVPSDESVLLFFYLGYANKEIKVGAQSEISVTLIEDTQLLDEVVVVGYGIQKKVNLTGAVNTVNTNQMIEKPVTSLTNALQGVVPGMTILSRPGDVGGDIGSINVRGRGNLGSSSPLYVVDGIPVEAGDFARVSPTDVESISILKDASASAIYGSRAAYGVILVTTKKGKSNKMQVQYNGTFGTQRPTVLPKMLGSSGYAMLRNEADINAGRTNLTFSDDALAKINSGSDPDYYPNNDWYGLAYRSSAPVWDSQLSVSGGNDATRYYISAGIMQQESLKPGKTLDRYTFRTNVESQVTKFLKIGTNVSYVRDQFDMSKGDFSTVSLARMVPTMVCRQSNGEWGSINAGNVDATQGKDNPVRFLEEGGRSEYFQNRFTGSLTASLTPMKGLSVDGLLSYYYYNNEKSTFTNEMAPLINFKTGNPMVGTGVTPNKLEEDWNNNGNFLAQATASYENQFNELNYGKLMIGTSLEDYTAHNMKVTRKNFVNNSLGAINGGSSDPLNTDAEGTKKQRTFLSFFGRLNYAFNERYLFEVNMRIDGSSQFAPDNRWGYFPSLSGAWRITQEEFLNDVSWLQELKLRGSWGKLGNINNVGFYDFYDGLTSGTAGILDQGRVDGVWPDKVANPLLTWENIDMVNAGLDGVLWRGKLNFQLDVFDKMTSNILLSDPNVPDEAGLTNKQTPSRNLGKVQNKGVELSLNYNGNIGDFNYSVGGNLSKIWNKVIKLDGISNYYTTGSYYVIKEGEPIGSFYMWKSDGLFVTNEEVAQHAFQAAGTKAGDIKYVNQNPDDDNIIDGNDRVITGNDVPYFTYGINFSASYKGFDLAVSGQGVPNVQVYIDGEGSQPFFNGAGVKEAHLDRWTKENPNPNASFPRILISSENTRNLKQSDFWLFDASYFRIKTLSFGYNLPKSLLRSCFIERAKIYIAANNLFTIRGDKRLKDFDPESPSNRSSYPQIKTLALGLNVTF